ncbi:4Fe-4S binding protein [Tunicatimonas pelagia]|uniref:4Fe-4S binding protein n=1 Tax=Tunicatimonas pelagia TaxID=931531 RepID=UPI002666E39A|nr:4Fe-4S binding protein [Tunicatimonas pelagia]WKN41001.1 4Fe-4S binding protein [Tunicatimonas pelagia]
MHGKSIIQLIGLTLFIAGFGFFVSIFFLSNYQLTPEVLLEQLGTEDEKNMNAAAQQTSTTESQASPSTYQLSLEGATEMLGQPYGSNFAFISDLEGAIQKVNEQAKSIYGISDEEANQIVEKIIAENGGTYQLDAATSVFSSGETGEAKAQKLRDYTNWLEGKEFGSAEELQNQLSGQISSINNDLARQRGIDKYRAKGLKTSVVKASTVGLIAENKLAILLVTFLTTIIGSLMYLLPRVQEHPGIKNNHIFHSALKHRGWLGIMVGTFLILFYIVLYFYPYYMTNWILLADPVSMALSGNPAGEFFLYGFLYTICIIVMGIRMIINYRHNRYQIIRTISVMFFQTAFAFLIPEILIRLNNPYFDFKNIWPLDYDFFFPSSLNQLIDNGTLGLFMLVWGIALIIVAVPVFVYFFGKRWYCSWVCGCGGLAETLGDPYRQLSDKSLGAWKVERYLIHGVLVFAVLMTIGMIYTFFTGSGSLLGIPTYTMAETYGFFIGAGFAGVIGTGFYPLMGNRVWCRFGCPLAAYLGLVQRFKSRFRITTNGGQCISCGNCSTYCEMGIDVRWYAQRGQNIIRSSCVGCGICSAVCPRGVLKLENGPEEGRFGMPIIIGNDSVQIDSAAKKPEESAILG